MPSLVTSIGRERGTDGRFRRRRIQGELRRWPIGEILNLPWVRPVAAEVGSMPVECPACRCEPHVPGRERR